MKYLGNVVNAYKVIARDFIKPQMTLVDATCGNGNDTLFLMKCLSNSGKLYAVDVQLEAIESTRMLMAQNGYQEGEHLILKHCSHECFDFLEADERVDFVVYNLGYLPKGDKGITTTVRTTLSSLASALERLKSGGLVIVLSYRGHEAGEEEAVHLEIFLSKLSQSLYDVCKLDFVNQKNTPPVMWIVEKK